MRALLTTSLGVLSTATLLLPPAAATAVQAPGPAHRNESPATSSPHISGSTRSVPLDLDDGAPSDRARHARTTPPGPGGSAQGPEETRDTTRTFERHVSDPFSLVGLVWEQADDPLRAVVQLRARSTEKGDWSAWQTLHELDDHAPSPADARGDASRGHRGSTAPLWVGRSDAVQVRVLGTAALPAGARLELVDPGDVSAPPADGDTSAGGATDGSADAETRAPRSKRSVVRPARLPALTKRETVDSALRQGLAAPGAGKHVGPRPGIVIRKGWGADEGLREGGYSYGGDVRMAFVHHTAGSNSYSCKEAPKVIRSIYRYHVKSLSWRDIGYNFLVDKCGTIYEGRAGGVTQPVRGAHTLGFNDASMGIAVLGDFSKKAPPKKATDALAKLTAWKLGLFGVDPGSTTTMTSEGGKHSKGTKVKLRTISGHRDGFATQCPGQKLYDELPAIRDLATRLQGR